MRGTAATLAAGALLGLFWWMTAIVSRQHGTTADEIFRVTVLGPGADGKHKR